MLLIPTPGSTNLVPGPGPGMNLQGEAQRSLQQCGSWESPTLPEMGEKKSSPPVFCVSSKPRLGVNLCTRESQFLDFLGVQAGRSRDACTRVVSGLFCTMVPPRPTECSAKESTRFWSERAPLHRSKYSLCLVPRYSTPCNPLGPARGPVPLLATEPRSLSAGLSALLRCPRLSRTHPD